MLLMLDLQYSLNAALQSSAPALTALLVLRSHQAYVIETGRIVRDSNELMDAY